MLPVFRVFLKCKFSARIYGRIGKYFSSYFNFAISINIVNIKNLIMNNHSFQSKIFELSGLWLILLLTGYSRVNTFQGFISNHYQVHYPLCKSVH